MDSNLVEIFANEKTLARCILHINVGIWESWFGFALESILNKANGKNTTDNVPSNPAIAIALELKSIYFCFILNCFIFG